jgi:hypothetical protein
LDNRFYNTTFSQLPGIYEIHSGAAVLKTLVDFILQRVSQVSDIAACLLSATEKYEALEGSTYTDCDLIIIIKPNLFTSVSY